MRWQGPDGQTRWLSYCTNVHAAEGIDELEAVVTRHGLGLRDALTSGSDWMGLGCRFGEHAVAELLADPARCAALRERWHSARLAPYTLNVFPQGEFHAEVVKRAVYSPDWTSFERFAYTAAAGKILSQLLPPSEDFGSLSTVPLGWRARGADLELATHSADRMCDLAVQWAQLEAETGKQMMLALEPEPSCALETSQEVVAWYEMALLGAARGRERVAGRTVEELVRRHIGVCLDTCHHAVVFEHPILARGRYLEAGIPIAKVQVSSALQVDMTDPKLALAALSRFDEPRFLHQVVARDERGDLHSFLDLPLFIESAQSGATRFVEARCHFHVPVHLGGNAPLCTTSASLVEFLQLEARQPSTRHYEVETYTFDLERHLDGVAVDLQTSLEAELRFTAQHLNPATSRTGDLTVETLRSENPANGA